MGEYFVKRDKFSLIYWNCVTFIGVNCPIFAVQKGMIKSFRLYLILKHQ